MDIELVNLINYLQSIKQDLHKKYKPEIVDGKSVLLNRNHSENEVETQSKTYIKLMHTQRRILYGANVDAKEQAAKHIQELNDQLDTIEESTEKIKITLKCASTQLNNDLCKPWNKIPTNLKIQSILKFIESLVPKLTDELKNQLRYLLISAISQKKLLKQSDVEYDSNNGCILKIHKLSYDGNLFTLLDDDNPSVSFDFSITEQSKLKKKLILIKK